ncbi:MAG: TonB-dependent receptor [Bacteroidales bacterium]|nr:TonB-dependent receptor [Bacteroidales bacterium]
MKCSKCESWLGRKFLFTVVAFVLSGVMAFAQTKTVTGTIVDEFGEPIIGANVLVKGTTNGAVTDIDGNYSITGVSNADELVVSYIGYASQTFPVGNQSTFNITMKEDGENLEEVVVVGYGVQKKKDLTGSVSSIKSADIQNVAAANAMQAMQAKVPGMDLQQSSGQAGAGVSITMRGNRSISADNGPLILVDGVVYGSTLDIPAGDIESMDILKDASSTAIYGSRGANGVILITTKRGKAGKTRVDLNAYNSFNSATSDIRNKYGMDEVQLYVDRANYDEYITNGNWGTNTYKEVFGNSALADGTLQTSIIEDGSFTDWYDTFMQNSTTQNYELSIAGGSEKTNFNISLAAMYDNGLLKDDKMDRYNGRINIDHKINKVVKVGASVAFTFKNHDSRFSLFNAARKMTTITHPYNTDGTVNIKPNPWYDSHVNPLQDEGDNYKKNVETTRFLGNAYLQLEPIKDLFLKTQFAIDRTNARTGTYQDFESVGRFQSPTNTYISNATSQSTKLNWQNTANYNKYFGEHSLGLLGGFEMQQSIAEGLSYDGTAGKEHYYTNSFYDVTKIQNDAKAGSTYTKSSLMSFFGRLNYGYDSRYLLQASVRADGASQLAKGNKWAAFPSVSAGWRIVDEHWMEGINESLRISNMKVRLSWGLSGNAAVNEYMTLAQVYATTPSSATDFIPMNMPNPDLTWEKTSAYNLGLDYGFLDGRINGTIDYYWTKTTDLLYFKSSPQSEVFTSVISNIGESKGQGIEVALNALAVRTKDFTWDINVSYTHSTDEIAYLADGLDQNITSYNNALIVGEPLSIFYDYETNECWKVGEYDAYVSEMASKGITVVAPITSYGTPGTLKIVDQNGDGMIDADNDRRVYNRSPKHIIGMTHSFTYKDFSLSLQMMARLGGYIAYEKNNALGLNDNYANWADVDYWTLDNQDARIPAPTYAHNNLKSIYSQYATSLLYEKADYFKIKDITLAYNLNKKWASKAFLSNAKIYCSLKNFITFNRLDDNYDPERGGAITFPLMKQVVIGVNLSF